VRVVVEHRQNYLQDKKIC